MANRRDATITWAEVEGAEPLEVAYLEDGPADGPLALCLHGYPDSAWTYRHLGPHLAARGWRSASRWRRRC